MCYYFKRKKRILNRFMVSSNRINNKLSRAVKSIEKHSRRRNRIHFHKERNSKVSSCHLFLPHQNNVGRINKNSNFTTFLGLTASLVNQNQLSETPTMQGHQHQISHGTRLATTRAEMVTVFLEPEFNERFSKAVDLLHLA